MDYIPLVTDDFRIAFCQATETLCSDVQRIIWENLLYKDIELEPPPAPKKCPITYSRVSGSSLPRNLFEKPTPEPITRQYLEYEEIIAINEAKEVIVLHMPRKYDLTYRLDL
jgi:hypothetical protein